MKKLLNFFKRGFEDLNYTYYKKLYSCRGRNYIGYVIVQNYRCFWIPMHRQIAVCLDEKELRTTLNLLKQL
jgi:hypothetical protein